MLLYLGSTTMRTYTRRRPDNQLIENVHELCRLCLCKTDGVVPIFTEETDSVCAVLALRIMICVGLEVRFYRLINVSCYVKIWGKVATTSRCLFQLRWWWCRADRTLNVYLFKCLCQVMDYKRLLMWHKILVLFFHYLY